MAFIKFLRGTATALPNAIQDGYVWLVKNTKALFVDVNDTRIRLNPPADWNETDEQSPSYVANKPQLGTVAEKNIAADVDQTQDIPTSRQVHNAIREVSRDIETIRQQVGKPYGAQYVVDMTDRTCIYVYTGSEAGYAKGHWYYYSGNNWVDGGAYNTAVLNTDKTLLVNGSPADAKATGDIVFDLQERMLDVESNTSGLTSDVDTLKEHRYYNIDIVNHGLNIVEI